ncbi:DUF4351 domain-containing protein [Phormidesmis sp. 146-12]
MRESVIYQGILEEGRQEEERSLVFLLLEQRVGQLSQVERDRVSALSLRARNPVRKPLRFGELGGRSVKDRSEKTLSNSRCFTAIFDVQNVVALLSKLDRAVKGGFQLSLNRCSRLYSLFGVADWRDESVRSVHLFAP